jgi:hypothetical protein
MMNLSLEKIKATQEKLNYPVFHKGDYNLNLVGIRSPNRIANNFDDLFVIYYKINNQWQYHQFPVTLDPGLTYLQTPFSPEAKKNGAFIIAPGFYRNLWKLGTFRGQYALIQINPVQGYRDNNWNHIIDLDPNTLTKGMFGILFHPHFQNTKIAQKVWNSSAGCIVPQSNDDFQLTINLCLKAKSIFGNQFSLTILHYEQLIQ